MLSIERVEDACGSNGVAPAIVARVELHVAQQRFVGIGVVGMAKGKAPFSVRAASRDASIAQLSPPLSDR